MLHIFKVNGHRIAYDTDGRQAFPISALAMKMVESVTPPMTRDCPSSLRYSLAKYDSQDLAAAYDELYGLYEKGLLFGEENKNPVKPTSYREIRVSGGNSDAAVQKALGDGSSVLFVTVDGCNAAETAALAGKYSDCENVIFFSGLTADSLTDADIAALNAARCYILAGNDLQESVVSLVDRGILYIHAQLPNDAKAVQKLAKELEKRGKNDACRVSLFETVFLIPEGTKPEEMCAECWAKNLCCGKHVTEPEFCEAERTALECRIALDSED